MILLLDNYDSFTYNVYQLLSELGAEVEVVRNDKISVDEAKNFDAVIISPGPGVPKDAGISEQLIDELKGTLPIFGICLGHQAIGEVFGGKVIRAKEIVHGKTSRLKHNGKGIYRGLAQGVEVGRYHSLIPPRIHLDARRLSHDEEFFRQTRKLISANKFLPSVVTGFFFAVYEKFLACVIISEKFFAEEFSA